MRKLLLLLGWLALMVPASAQDRPLRVGWEEFPPIQISDTGDRPGIDIELVRLLLKDAGYAIQLRKMPWNRVLVQMEHGDLDIALAASVTDERRSYAEWTDSYRTERTVLWGLTGGAPKVDNLRSLLGTKVRIGYLRGSVFSGEFEELAKDRQFQSLLVPVNAMKPALAMLRAGRLEYILEDLSTFANLLARSPGAPVEQVATINLDKLHFMVSKKTIERDPEIVTRLNAALGRLKKARAIERVLMKYGVPP